MITNDETSETPEPVEPEGWKGITDDALAAWALARLAEYETERDRIRANAQAWIEQVQADAAADEHPLTDKIAWFTAQLVDYYHRLPDPPATYKLPNGRIQARKGRASTRVVDPDLFLEWAESAWPDAIKRTPLVSPLADWQRTDDGQVVTPYGEVVPGVEVHVGEPTVTVKTAGKPQ